jgi:hypothetical protein
LLVPDDVYDLSCTNTRDEQVLAGCFPGLTIISATNFILEHPLQLSQHFLEHRTGRVVHLQAMHSTSDWFAFTMWQDGFPQRVLSLSPDTGIIEDIGPRLAFEQPYWEGKHPVVDRHNRIDPDFPLPFHPMDLGRTALLTFWGFQIEGDPADEMIDTAQIPLMNYRR